MPDDYPEFRLGTVLATSFTATLTERAGDPVERIPTPGRLVDWLDVSGLAVTACTAAQFDRARELREAIHTAATAAALDAAPPAPAVEIINRCSAAGNASARLTPEGNHRWELTAESDVDDALGVIAADAIGILSGARDGRLALCASPTCRAAFFDTSRSRSRRWCEMNTCGNREKKARFNAHRRPSGAADRAARK
ncbi:ABATE domain-containing protein [Tsukamurella sp. 1534]|uniref:CGNR zinc finger domain-containing protein n=1 Tax=Tsukamurella sp. 1534 TaxID=1151061 RepID=UPI0003122897|nr:CGNR zinc finger domain-containing protein [Tsukamurella sp. 1534]